MQYWHWLVGISLFFLVLERIFPWRKQKLLRKSILTDTIYLVFNAHYLNIAIETVQIFILLKLNDYVKINDYLSTNLIIQCLYDDNAIKRVQLREVFGLAINLNLLELPAFK
mgnify:CR=1 FL=1